MELQDVIIVGMLIIVVVGLIAGLLSGEIGSGSDSSDDDLFG